MRSIPNKLIIESAYRFGTPHYLYDFSVIEYRYQCIRELLDSSCDIFYSMKANPLMAICQCLKNSGASCEISSENELKMALMAGFLPEQIIFVGPGKNKIALSFAIENNIRAIVCESLEEVLLINEIAKKYHKIMSVMIRINPDFSVARAPIKMSGIATQFGMTTAFFLESIETIKECHSISVEGIQIYNASRVLDVRSIEENIGNILQLAEWLSKKSQLSWKIIDFGGGFGVPYFENEVDLDINTLVNSINLLISDYQKKYPETKFILELGRYLVAESGYLVGSVQSVKKNHDKNYVVVDSGMHCHLGMTGIGSFVHRNFPMRHISMRSCHINFFNKNRYQIVGPLCTPGDVLLREVALSSVYTQDLIVIEKTGAYGLTASPGRFLSHGSPAEVVYFKNELKLSRRRETVQDLLSTQSLL